MQLRRSGPVTAFPTSEAIHARDPRDLTRLLWFLAVAALGVLAARGADRTTAGLEGDLVELVGHLPDAVVGFVIVAVQVLYTLFFLGIPLVLLATRRFRRWGIYTLGWVLTTALVIASERLVDGKDVPQLPDSGLSSAQYEAWPPSQSVAHSRHCIGPALPAPAAGLAAVRVGIRRSAGSSAGRHRSRRGPGHRARDRDRRGGRVRVAARVRPEGQPADDDRGARRPGPDRPVTTDRRAGRPAVDRVAAVRGHHARRPAPALQGRRVRPVRGRQPAAQLPPGPDARHRRGRRVLIRAPRCRGRGDAVDVRRACRRRTPTCLAVAPIGLGDDMLLAFREVRGTTLDLVPAERLTDEVLDQAWASIASLRTAGVAHRDLQLSNWILDDSDQLWLIDFSFGEPGGLRRGPRRGHRGTAGSHVLGCGCAACGRFCRPGLGHVHARDRSELPGPGGPDPPDPRGGQGPARRAWSRSSAETAEACGVEEPQFAPIERVKPRSLVMAGLLVVAIYVLLPQLTDVPPHARSGPRGRSGLRPRRRRRLTGDLPRIRHGAGRVDADPRSPTSGRSWPRSPRPSSERWHLREWRTSDSTFASARSRGCQPRSPSRQLPPRRSGSASCTSRCCS